MKFLVQHFRKALLIIIYSELNGAYIRLVSTKDNIDDWIGFGFNFVAWWRNEVVFCLMSQPQWSSYDFYHFEENIINFDFSL